MPGDEIGRTATQVRLSYAGKSGPIVVHKVTGSRWEQPWGRVYLSRCGLELKACGGAMLTTRPASCRTCVHAGADVLGVLAMAGAS